MDLTYKQAIETAMDRLLLDPAIKFVGYGLLKGKNGCGLRNVPDERIQEFTVAEGLMTSAAIGMSLMGIKPVVLIERADFIWNAMDAIVNHLDACETISNGEFRPTAIIRVIVGNRYGPL
jgi:pyruvate/2-oxoglutarate/acetoin dehydrogenase E1 component